MRAVPLDALAPSTLVERALVYAVRVHAGQVRKGSGVPYYSHLLGTASLVAEAGGDEEEVAAALLHDAVEDQGGRARLDEIRAHFGERVAAIVDGCSDTDVTPKPPWQERKERYLEHLRDADPSVVLVSNADKLHNARTLLLDYREVGESLWGRFNASREQTLWYYRSLVDAYLARGRSALAGELARVVGELEALVAASGEGG